MQKRIVEWLCEEKNWLAKATVEIAERGRQLGEAAQIVRLLKEEVAERRSASV